MYLEKERETEQSLRLEIINFYSFVYLALNYNLK